MAQGIFGHDNCEAHKMKTCHVWVGIVSLTESQILDQILDPQLDSRTRRVLKPWDVVRLFSSVRHQPGFIFFEHWLFPVRSFSKLLLKLLCLSDLLRNYLPDVMVSWGDIKRFGEDLFKTHHDKTWFVPAPPQPSGMNSAHNPGCTAQYRAAWLKAVPRLPTPQRHRHN